VTGSQRFKRVHVGSSFGIKIVEESPILELDVKRKEKGAYFQKQSEI